MIKSYKGYSSEFWFEPDDNAFHGWVRGIRDVVHFEAATITDIQKEFEASVDDYLEACEQFGQEPQKPKSGKLAVRMAPEVHELVATAATHDAKSVNQWIIDTLEVAARERIAEGSIKIKVR